MSPPTRRPQRSRVPAVPPTFHLRMRLLTPKSTVGPWANHVFRVEVGRGAPPPPPPGRGGRPPPPPARPAATVLVYGLVTAAGLVDALIPADWQTAILDVGDALPSGAATTPASLEHAFGGPRLTIPLEKVAALGPPPPPAAAGTPGHPRSYDLERGAQQLTYNVAAQTRPWIEIGMRLINLGYLHPDHEMIGTSADLLTRRAIRGYVFRQINRAAPVRSDLFDTLRRALLPDDAGEQAITAPELVAALLEHLRAVHDDPNQVP